MKLIIPFFILIIFTSKTIAQVDTSFINLTQELIRQYQRFGTIYYSEYNKQDVKSSSDFWLKQRAIKCNNNEKIVLTYNERLYIVSQLKKFQTYFLKDSLFPDSKKLLYDSILKFTSNLNKIKADSFFIAHDTIGAWKYMRSNLRLSSFFFTNPIYIRHKTVYIIYFTWLLGYNSGESKLFFYKKENNKWSKWKSASLGYF